MELKTSYFPTRVKKIWQGNQVIFPDIITSKEEVKFKEQIYFGVEESFIYKIDITWGISRNI